LNRDSIFFGAMNSISWPWKSINKAQIYLQSPCTCYPKSLILP
jgi:hypothetical protein